MFTWNIKVNKEENNKNKKARENFKKINFRTVSYAKDFQEQT